MYDIAIIGGGASGLAAACQTVGAVNKEGRPLSVIVIEKENRCGKKLLATGNGRCNLTNVDTDLSHYHGSVKEIAASVFEKTDDRVLQRFWQDLGIEYTQGDRGKLYPRSLQASSVLNALRRKMEKGGVIEKTGSRLTGLRRTKAGYYELSLLVEKKDPQEDKPGSGRTRGGKPSVKAVYEKEKLTAHTVLICMGACYLLTSRAGLGLWIYIPGFILGLGASFMTAYKLWISVSEKERKKAEEEPPAFNSHN